MPPANHAGEEVWLDGRDPVRLGKMLGQPGAEGAAYTVEGRPDLAIKIQDHPTAQAKLRWMMQLPASTGRARAAWPNHLVSRRINGQLIHSGYAMPRVHNPTSLEPLTNPSQRPRVAHWHWLHLVAGNLIEAVELVHGQKVIFADLNPKNVLVEVATCNVTMIDLDSALIAEPGPLQKLHSGLGYVGYLPPELLIGPSGTFDKNQKARLNRSVAADSFTLGIMLFFLLMDAHPFYAASASNTSHVDNDDEATVRGVFPYGPGKPASFNRPVFARAFESLHPDMQRCFIRCFQDGYRQPGHRPTIVEWRSAVTAETRGLKQCGAGHWYVAQANYCNGCAGPPKTRMAARKAPPPDANPVRQPTPQPPTPSRKERLTPSILKRLAIPVVALMIALYFFGASGAVLGGVVDAGQWTVSSAKGLFQSDPSSPPLALAPIPPAQGITSSDSRNGGNSTYVLDGNPQTSWVATTSSASPTTYLQLDLGEPQSIEFVQWIIPQSGVGATVKLYVSNDGKNWTLNRTVVLTRDDVGVVRNRRLVADARYVRLEFADWKSSKVEAEVAEVRVILTGETSAIAPPPAHPAVATSTVVPAAVLSNSLPTVPPKHPADGENQAIPTIAPRR